ncbi:MAG: glutamate--tRNA ligase [Bacteroidales bacterium]|nr:glutamate--tRNA ligase [Bacteroidales bacterium]
MNKVRVRFAPSPTGPLHIGGVRTALYNYLFAKKNGGEMLLRIEDTDQTRFVPGAEKYIIEAFHWLNIPFDEGVHIGGPFAPYKQSERKDLYWKYAKMLIDNGNAYYAFDTPEALDEMRKSCEANKQTFIYNSITRKTLNNALNLSAEEVQQKLDSGSHFVIRFKMPENKTIEMHDIIRGQVTVNTDTLDDKVLFKSDGMPTYHLANIVDDHLMEISHVIRGEEWLPSMPLHIMLYEAFGWEAPQFAHLPLLLRPDGNGKLSKRDGDRLGFPVFPLRWVDPKTGETARGYREDDYFPEAFINMLALLGWNDGTEQEIFPMEELIEKFSLERVGKSGAKFNVEKAKWFNHKYLQQKDNAEIAKSLMLTLHENGVEADAQYVEKVVAVMKERVNFTHEIWTECRYMFQRPESYDPQSVKKRWKEDTPQVMENIVQLLTDISNWKNQTVHDALMNYIQEHELSVGQVMNSLRILMVGSSSGPDLTTMMDLFGKEETIERIKIGTQSIVNL